MLLNRKTREEGRAISGSLREAECDFRLETNSTSQGVCAVHINPVIPSDYRRIRTHE